MRRRSRSADDAHTSFSEVAQSWRVRGVFILVTLMALLTPCLAAADAVRVEIHNAPPGTQVQAQATGSGVEQSTSGTADANGDLSMLLEFGSLGKAKVEVYQDDCGGQATVAIVAAGGQSPSCEEEQANGGNCHCRRLGAIWLHGGTSVVKVDWKTGSVTTTAGKTGFSLGVGEDFVHYGGKDPAVDPAFERELKTDDSDSGISIFGEYAFLPAVAIGLGYEELGKIGLAATLTYKADPSLQIQSRGEIDPWAAESYLRLSHWFSSRSALSVMIGAAYWKAQNKSSETLFASGTEVASDSSKSTNDGWSPYLGASYDHWFKDWLGMRVAYKWIKMNQNANSKADRAEIDRTAQALRLLVMFGF